MVKWNHPTSNKGASNNSYGFGWVGGFRESRCSDFQWGIKYVHPEILSLFMISLNLFFYFFDQLFSHVLQWDLKSLRRPCNGLGSYIKIELPKCTYFLSWMFGFKGGWGLFGFINPYELLDAPLLTNTQRSWTVPCINMSNCSSNRTQTDRQMDATKRIISQLRGR